MLKLSIQIDRPSSTDRQKQIIGILCDSKQAARDDQVRLGGHHLHENGEKSATGCREGVYQIVVVEACRWTKGNVLHRNDVFETHRPGRRS